MYRFNDKQRRQLLEDALVAELLEAGLNEERDTSRSVESAAPASASSRQAESRQGPKAPK